jgi:hypothetical protein
MKETYQGVRGVPEQVAPSAERSRFCGVAKTGRYLTLPRGRFIRRHVAFDSQHQPPPPCSSSLPEIDLESGNDASKRAVLLGRISKADGQKTAENRRQSVQGFLQKDGYDLTGELVGHESV